MTIEAVFFDFSGTLFRLEHNESWLADLTDEDGDPLDIAAQTELLRRMTAPAEQVVALDPEHQYAWDNRDLDPAQHQKVYLEVLKRSGVAKLEQAKALYSRLTDPDQWTPYPDASAALKNAADAGARVGVISNIAFDIRPAFSRLDGQVDDFVLSFEEGMIKPDARIFQRALDRLEVRPEQALMIGDSAEADGGARALGCAFALVEPAPTDQRPDALLAALHEHGVR